MKQYPPEPGMVSTLEAATIYGVHARTFLRRMREAEVRPLVVRGGGSLSGKTYWWRPTELLRVRAERKRNPPKRKPSLTRDYAAAAFKGQRTRNEQYRNKKLAPMAQARGLTIPELRRALGIDRGGPND